METKDVMPVAGNAGADCDAPEPLSRAGGGRNGILDGSGPGVGLDVAWKEKTSPEGGVLDAGLVAAVGSGATSDSGLEGGDEAHGKGGTLLRCEAVQQMPSGGVSAAVENITVSDTKDAEIEAGHEAQAAVITGGGVTDAVMKPVAVEAATDVSSSVKEGAVAVGGTQSVQMGSLAELSKGLNTKVNGSVSASPNCSPESANAKGAEESLARSRAVAQNTETVRDFHGGKKSLENVAVNQDTRKDGDRYRINSSIAEGVAAGVAAGVAEGIAESIAETIAKETAGASGPGSMEGRVFDSGRFERMAIAKAVAEVIAESVAQEVAQGLADGLAEAAATAEAFGGVEQKKPDNIQGMADENKEGVLCDCGLVAVVRVVGEKSPNRGLRYLMCSRQDPSFFKRKGKRKDSDTIGKCKFFRWLDTPRHTSKEDKKNQEKEKTQLEELNVALPTLSLAKESNLESNTSVGILDGGGGEVLPSEIPTSTSAEDTLLVPEATESTPDLKVKPARKQRKRGLAEESGKDDILDADRPASAGTLTRYALRKGAPEPVQEPSLDTSAVSTPVSALGKRTIDWTDSYIGPESQVIEKGVSFRKRRSVRGESGPSSRYSIGGSGSGRSTGFGSSEKKPLHYFRRSTGQVGALGNEPINVDSPHPLTDVRSPGAGQSDERDNRFKSYYKKGKIGSSSEQKSKSTSATTGDKLQPGAGRSRVNRAAEEVSPVETEKRNKSQTRRQQRKLPLSEVYGAMEHSLPVKATSTRTNTLVGTDHSLSPPTQSLEKSTPSGVASEYKEIEHSKSPPKKRKLSWVLSEDAVVQETDAPRRTSARKGISVNNGKQNSLFPTVETPLLASAFPTVRYEAKLPAEDYHDPDDPYSLEIPWAKQEHEEEKTQQPEREKETCKDERNGEAVEGGDSEVRMNVGETIEAVSEAPATGEELPLTVPESAELTGFENSGDICGPVSSENTLNAAGGEDSDIPKSLMDQKTIDTIVDTGPSLLDGPEVGDVLKENHVDIEHEESIMPDKALEVTSISSSEEGLPESNTLISGNPISSVHSRSDTVNKTKSQSTHLDQVEVAQRSGSFAELPPDKGSLLSAPDLCGHLVQKDQVVEDVQELVLGGINDSKVPEEVGAIFQGHHTSVLPDEQSTGDKSQTSILAAETGTRFEACEHESDVNESAILKVGEATIEDVVMHEGNVLLGGVAIVGKDCLSKLDDTVGTDNSFHCERSEPPLALSDAAVTNEGELVLSGDGRGVDNLQGNVTGTDAPIEEPAISGSNLMAAAGFDSRVGQVNNRESERDLALTSLDQDAAFKSPHEADNAGAAAASENAGFVNSVRRSASGKKTRSIGSIGAPAVTSKRSRSVVPSQKGGRKGGAKHQAEVQWVDVPLDWRNEKSTGRVPLLPNFSAKGLNGSDTTQSEMRLLQSADTSQGTHSTRPRIRRGEVDDSSIVTEEKGKGHDACNEDSTEYNAQITNLAAHARQATLGSTGVGDEASVPADEYGLLGGPTDEQADVAEGDKVLLPKKRGRPRKDSKCSVGLQYSVASGHLVDGGDGANQTPEPELAGVVGKADGELTSLIHCTTTMEDNATTELHGEDRVSQLERSASNTEREKGKPEGVSSEPDEGGRPLDGSDVPSAILEDLDAEIIAPHCLCKVVPRRAVLKTIIRSGDPNQGLRYWSCTNYRKLFTKKKKLPSDVTEESCNYFRWLDTPRVTAKDKREARKERYRQVELQRLL